MFSPKLYNLRYLLGFIILILFIGYFFRLEWVFFQANKAVEENSSDNAEMLLRHILQEDPTHEKALQALAKLLEERSPMESAHYYSKAAEETGELDLWLKALNMYMRLQQRDKSKDLAQLLDKNFPSSPKRNRILALEALQRNDFEKAQRYTKELAESANLRIKDQFIIIVQDLLNPKTKQPEEALRQMEDLVNIPEISQAAMRFLTGFYTNRKNWDQALQWSQRIQDSSKDLIDQINHLYIAIQANEPPQQIKNTFDEIKEKADRNTLLNLSTFFWDNHCIYLIEDLVSFLKERDENDPACIFLEVKLLASQEKWDDLFSLLSAHSDLKENPQALFWMGLSKQKTGSERYASYYFKQSRILARKIPPLQFILADLAFSFRSDHIGNAYLWDCVEQRNNAMAALSLLENYYQATRSLEDYARAQLHKLKEKPSYVSRNNRAASLLLLGKSLENALELAKEAYREMPKNPVVATTYAHALTRQDRIEEATQVFEEIPLPWSSHTWLYYSALLEKKGDKANALIALGKIGTLSRQNYWKEEIELYQDIKTWCHAPKE